MSTATPTGIRGPALNAAVGAPLHDHVTVRPGTERYWRALKEVLDPELPISVVDMGLIHDIRAREPSEAGGAEWAAGAHPAAGADRTAGTDASIALDVTMTFTATACPCMELMLMDIRDRLLQEDGVGEVAIDIVWDPPWNRAMITDEGRAMLRKYGVAS